jgi:hypothetical protein
MGLLGKERCIMSITDYYSEYTCDNCGRKETTYRKYSGPDGWLELKELHQQLGEQPEDKELQFCSHDCLREFDYNS